jgi:hypothetical protein
MKRFSLEILLALIVGIGLGLVYAWMIAPRRVTNANPSTLRADFKEQYRAAIAAAYAATDNLARARARLQLLKDPDSVEALNAQAQQMLARGESSQAADQVASLAQALVEGDGEVIPTLNPATPIADVVEEASTRVTASPSAEIKLAETETPLATSIEETQPVLPSSTPRPKDTLAPTQGAPFRLASQDEACDPNLPEGLLQIIVLSPNRRQIPGMEIDITWENGEEKFFTGLKPDLGNGYADFTMSPQVSYSLQLAAGSAVASGLVAPTCQNPDGGNYYGSLKLTFQQP